MLHHLQQVLINMKECKVEIIPNIVAGEVPYQQYTNQEKTLIGVPVAEEVEGNPLLGSENLEQSLFNPNDPDEVIEVSIYDLNDNYLDTIYDFKDYAVVDDTNTEGSGSINTLNLDPAAILAGVGIAFGTFTIVNRFLKNRLGTNQENQDVFIEEISSDRTEVRLNSTKIPSEELVNQANALQSELSGDNYFGDFYLNFGQNQLYIANNILVDTQTNPDNPSILVHLYEPLPDNVQLNESLYIVTEQADPLNLAVELPVEFQPADIEPDEVPYLEGPNFNVEIQSQFNNPTDYLSYNSLTQVPLTSSYNQLQNILNQKGVSIDANYTQFDDFVHFSSAKQRLNNFYYKVGLIQSASFELGKLSESGATYSISSSKSAIETTITNIISNFDGFENYMYYESTSLAWPKQNTEAPYTLYGTGSTEVLEWLGSDIPSNQYFGGRIESASNFDNLNPDALIKAIPEYLRDDPDNAPYDLFINMIGQHFDDLYLYTKNVTNRYNNDNRLDTGISKDLVAQALRDFGIKLYQNNFSSNDLYSAFLGINASGSIFPPTGSELITSYVTGSDQAIPLNDVNKEVYKRLYHNLPYLLKKKGTIEGLRALITCFGVPTTVLRISEFGGKDRVNANDWDYFYEKYGKALTTSNGLDNAYPKIPWLPLTSHQIDNEEFRTPDTVAFRFKTSGIPDPSNYSQSLWIVGTEKTTNDSNLDTENNFDIGLFLYYTGSWALESGSWSGSAQSNYKEYGDLQLILRKGNNLEYVTSSKVNLPFFNQDWWSVMVRRNDSFGLDNIGTATTYDIICKSRPYRGADGTTIALQGSGSLDNSSGNNIPEINSAWSYFSQSSAVSTGLIFQPGTGYGARFGYAGLEKRIGTDVKIPSNVYFSGSIQEVRYYNLPLSESVFDDYVMNPESIEGISISGSGSSFATLAFRAPLGNELVMPKNNEQGLDKNFQTFTSIHPSITSSIGLTTGSFLVADYTDSPTGEYTTSSNYYIRDNQELGGDTERYALRNDEVVYIDQPVVGIKNRITDKIRLENTEILGNSLSSIQDVEDDPITNKSYTRDINYLEVAFSPQNEINDDIVASLGYFDIGGYIGDPRQVTQSNYPDLDALREQHFYKYQDKYNLKDYVRLIKYFDNSLFKMIKDFVPARTGVATGVVIKQHLLERNKYVTPQVAPALLNYSESIDVGSVEGGSGGVFEFEGRNKPFYPVTPQQFQESINTVAGVMKKTHKDESEYYDGELKGTEFIATDGEVGPGGDFEPLHGNADDSTRSDLYYTVEYDSGDIIPSNLDDIVDGLAQPADVEDFNYFSPRSYIPRYEGSKHNAVAFGALNRSTGYIPVDPGSVYFTNIVKAYDTSPEYINKTFLSIDKFVTQNSDVYDPRNRTIPQFIDFKHTFKRGDVVDVKLDALNDVRTYDELPGSHSIFRIGRYNTLLATNSSTSSLLAPQYPEGHFGSRIGRINMVDPLAIDQGDPLVILPVDPAEEIPTPINFRFKGEWATAPETRESYFKGTVGPDGAFTPGNNDLNTNCKILSFENDRYVPQTNDGSKKFGLTGWWEDDGIHLNNRSIWPDAFAQDTYEQDWSEQGYEVWGTNNYNAGQSAIGSGIPDQEYVMFRFTKDNITNFQNTTCNVKLHLFLMNMRTSGNGINVTLFMGARTGAGEEKWGRICQREMEGDTNNDKGAHYLWEITVNNVEYFEGDFIYAWIRCDQARLFVMSERGTNDWDQSYFEITTNPANLTEPEEPEDPGEPEGLPAQLYLNYFTAEEVPFPETSEYYTDTTGQGGDGGTILLRGPSDDPTGINAAGMVSAVGLEPVLRANIGQLQILSSSQTEYFSRGPYEIPQDSGDPIIVIPPSSSRGYDQSIVIPFEPRQGDEMRWAYDETQRRTIIKKSSKVAIRGEAAGELTTCLHLDRPIPVSQFENNGQNFIITRIIDNNSGFMLDTRKKFPDIGDSTTKESYVTPRLISSKLDNDLYSIVRDLSTDEGVF
jgi:hypothetical protein